MKETLQQQAARLGIDLDPPRSYPLPDPPVTVADLIERLEFDKFRSMGDSPTWDALNEVQQLAREQLADDTTTEGRGSRRARIGRIRIESTGRFDVGGEKEAGSVIWPRYTPDQVALERGFRPFLDRLTDNQRDALRLVIWGSETEREAARDLGITRDSLRDRRDGAIRALGRLLRAAFVPGYAPPPEDVEGPEEAAEEPEPLPEAPGPHGPIRVSQGGTSVVFPALLPSEEAAVIARGNERTRDGQVNRRFTEEQYALLTAAREQARGDAASMEGHHFSITRVHDHALDDYEGDES